MKKLIILLKNKKVLYSAVVVGAVLAAVFLIFVLIVIEKEKAKDGLFPILLVAPKEKTIEETIESLTAPVSDKKEKNFTADEVFDSLTPFVTNNDSTLDVKDTENDEISEKMPIIVSENIINSLTAPEKK